MLLEKYLKTISVAQTPLSESFSEVEQTPPSVYSGATSISSKNVTTPKEYSVAQTPSSEPSHKPAQTGASVLPGKPAQTGSLCYY